MVALLKSVSPWMQLALLLCSVLLHQVDSLQPGQRVSALYQTVHSNLKTTWIELPIEKMPLFGMKDNVIFEARVPKLEDQKKASPLILDPRKDLVISMSFAGRKLVVPHVMLYDASKKRSLRQLTVRFTRDEYEIIRVDFDTEYGPSMKRVDPTHPSLRAFEIEYQWENVEEEDFSLGVRVMFSSVVIAFLIIFCMVIFSSEIGGGHLMMNVGGDSYDRGSVGGGSGGGSNVRGVNNNISGTTKPQGVASGNRTSTLSAAASSSSTISHEAAAGGIRPAYAYSNSGGPHRSSSIGGSLSGGSSSSSSALGGTLAGSSSAGYGR